MTGDLERPLSNDELELVDDGLGLARVLGLLQAVLVAPGMIPPSRWVPLVFADVSPQPDVIQLVLRLYNQVSDLLRDGGVWVPEEDDDAGCVAFAAGYAAGAALDPTWLGDDNHWTFAMPLAYLGGRRELVPPDSLADYDAEPERRQVILRDLGRLIITTYSTFAKYRLSSPQRSSPIRSSAPRVGRNEPCPCGSGKKYKRCCLDRSA